MAERTWNMSNLDEAHEARQLRKGAKVRIPMPDPYMYGLIGGVDDERDSDVERGNHDRIQNYRDDLS